MEPLPEARSGAITPADKLPPGTASTVSPEDYQQLLLSYQRIEQERDILYRALRAFSQSKHRQSS